MGEKDQEEMPSPKLKSPTSDAGEPNQGNKKSRRLWGFILAAVLLGGLLYGAFYLGTHLNRPENPQKMQGTVALTEQGLRDVVNKEHLTVYWTGPVAGDKYTLFIPKTGSAVVRYLPQGAVITDASPTFRLVATFIQKGAYSLALRAITQKANLGFLNIDGNAAYYVKTRPTNVFVGLKGKDVLIEIFDPGQGQAVALALFKGQIQQVK